MGHRAWLLASMRDAHVCCGRVARQWTPEHEIHDTGKVFLRRSTRTEYMHTHTEPDTSLNMCPCGVWRSAQVHIQTPVDA